MLAHNKTRASMFMVNRMRRSYWVAIEQGTQPTASRLQLHPAGLTF